LVFFLLGVGLCFTSTKKFPSPKSVPETSKSLYILFNLAIPSLKEFVPVKSYNVDNSDTLYLPTDLIFNFSVKCFSELTLGNSSRYGNLSYLDKKY
jgi:hypothetical protein